MEEVVGDTYRRSLPDGSVADVDASTADGIETDDPRSSPRVFDLDAPAAEIADVLGRDPLLRLHARPPCAGRRRRLRDRDPRRARPADLDPGRARRTPRGWSPPPASRSRRPRGTVTHVFPTAEAIAAAPDSAFAMPARRRETLRSLAGTPLDELISLPGIGPWTQAYVAMRALRDRDAWLPTDLGVRHALARIGHDGDAERWRPYRAYAVVHLWTLLSSAPGRS